MFVSVVIPTHNRAQFLRRAIESVLALKSDALGIEVIVVDDGSTDETPAVIAEYPVRSIRLNGVGASAARNAGMVHAQGELLAFLDDDDVFTPENLAPQVALMQERPDYGAVVARMRLTDNALNPVGPAYPETPLAEDAMYNALLDYIPQLGSVVIRTAVCQEVGGLNVALHGSEDWDLMMRIVQRYPIGFLNHTAVLCRQHSGQRPGAEQVTQRRMADTLRVMSWYQRRSMSSLLRSARRELKIRGFFVPFFLGSANNYMQAGQRLKALRCIGMAFQASPLHTTKQMLGSWRNWFGLILPALAPVI